jgi:hypothetical protein
VLAAGTLKLMVLPAVMLAIAVGLGAGPHEAAIATVYGALPASASAYVMARLMGGDAPFLAASITATTLAAGISLPLILVILDFAGFLVP